MHVLMIIIIIRGALFGSGQQTLKALGLSQPAELIDVAWNEILELNGSVTV